MESPQHSTPDTIVSVSIGPEQKDHWAKAYREGDLEAGIRLARCYELAGEMAEGLIVINDVLKHKLGEELRSKALLRKAALQKDSPATAWATIKKAFFDVSPGMCGQLHNQRGRILSDLKKLDPAIIEYTAAAYYFEMDGSPELMGLAWNNIASVYRKLKRYPEAHESVDKSLRLWRPSELFPNALDQKAAIYVAEKDYQKARVLSSQALDTVGEHRRWKVEFLCTLSNAQAGLGEFVGSLTSIEEALAICEYLDDQSLKLKVLMARKMSCEIMYQVSDHTATNAALKLSGGNVRQAAHKLGMNHSALRKSIKKHSVDVKVSTPKR